MSLDEITWVPAIRQLVLETITASLKDALERIVARSVADDDADEKELRRQLWHIEDPARWMK